MIGKRLFACVCPAKCAPYFVWRVPGNHFLFSRARANVFTQNIRARENIEKELVRKGRMKRKRRKQVVLPGTKEEQCGGGGGGGVGVVVVVVVRGGGMRKGVMLGRAGHGLGQGSRVKGRET